MAKKSIKKKVGGKYSPQERYDFLVKIGETNSAALRKNSTPQEDIIFRYLVEFGYRFEFQKPVITQRKTLYIVDFLLIDYQVVIEIDGRFHGTKENQKKDTKRSKDLKKEGYKVMRFWNTQIMSFTKETLHQIIKDRIKLNS